MRRTYSQSKEKPSGSREIRHSDSRWEELMRKFSNDCKRRDRCKPLRLHLDSQQRPLQQFCTGSSYEGTWDDLGMNGFGTYTYPNGVIYEGEFEDNLFHGSGVLRYPSGITVRGQWVKGELAEKTIVFADDVQYREKDWKYTRQPDRRFSVEHSQRIKPAGASVLSADQPTKPIPEGYYDTGDGFYGAKTKLVFSYDMTSVLRSPSAEERRWIEANCRTNPDKIVGPYSSLYEEWREPKIELSNEGSESPSLYCRGSKESVSHDKRWNRGEKSSIPKDTTTGGASGVWRARSFIKVSERGDSYWETLMRKFSEANQEKCKSTCVEMPCVERSTKKFPTGSQYEGTWDVLGMSGFGTYTFPHGVVYEGEFEDGMFHGAGELRYESGAIIRGKWKHGRITEKTVVFADGLEFRETDWKYCRMPDRRFTKEYEEGMQPAYSTAEQPSVAIPTGYYDTGDGFYDPKTKIVYKYDDLTAIVRSPSLREQNWILANCRNAADAPVGPTSHNYEEWQDPKLKLQTPVPPVPTRSQQSNLIDQDHENEIQHIDDFDETTWNRERFSMFSSESRWKSRHLLKFESFKSLTNLSSLAQRLPEPAAKIPARFIH